MFINVINNICGPYARLFCVMLREMNLQTKQTKNHLEIIWHGKVNLVQSRNVNN